MSGMKSGSKDRQYQYENPFKSNLFLFDVGLCHTIIQHEKPQLGPVLIVSGKTVYKLNLKSGSQAWFRFRCSDGKLNRNCQTLDRNPFREIQIIYGERFFVSVSVFFFLILESNLRLNNLILMKLGNNMYSINEIHLI